MSRKTAILKYLRLLSSKYFYRTLLKFKFKKKYVKKNLKFLPEMGAIKLWKRKTIMLIIDAVIEQNVLSVD